MKTKSITLIAGLCMALIAGYAIAADFAINVVDGETGEPIAGACVTMDHLTTSQFFTEYTNAEGDAYFTDIPSGAYLLTITADGYQPYTEQMYVEDGEGFDKKKRKHLK